MPLWGLEQLTPGPLSHERGGGRGIIQCIFHTDECIYGGNADLGNVIHEMDRGAALVGSLRMTSLITRVRKPHVIQEMDRGAVPVGSVSVTTSQASL